MATVIDPVCGMRIEADDAAAIAEQEGQTDLLLLLVSLPRHLRLGSVGTRSTGPGRYGR
jgi:hypothetical protein